MRVEVPLSICGFSGDSADLGARKSWLGEEVAFENGPRFMAYFLWMELLVHERPRTASS